MRRLGAHTAAVDAVTMSIDPRWAASIGGHEAKRWDLEQYCEANIWPSGTRGPLPEIPPQDSTIVRSAPSGRPQARLSCSVWVGFCRVYQYAIIRPAVVAASQAARDKPPKTRSFRCSEFDVEERIADVFRRLGNQQANAGGGRDAKAGGRDGNGRLASGQRDAAPHRSGKADAALDGAFDLEDYLQCPQMSCLLRKSGGHSAGR